MELEVLKYDLSVCKLMNFTFSAKPVKRFRLSAVRKKYLPIRLSVKKAGKHSV